MPVWCVRISVKITIQAVAVESLAAKGALVVVVAAGVVEILGVVDLQVPGVPVAELAVLPVAVVARRRVP